MSLRGLAGAMFSMLGLVKAAGPRQGPSCPGSRMLGRWEAVVGMLMGARHPLRAWDRLQGWLSLDRPSAKFKRR